MNDKLRTIQDGGYSLENSTFNRGKVSGSHSFIEPDKLRESRFRRAKELEEEYGIAVGKHVILRGTMEYEIVALNRMQREVRLQKVDDTDTAMRKYEDPEILHTIFDPKKREIK